MGKSNFLLSSVAGKALNISVQNNREIYCQRASFKNMTRIFFLTVMFKFLLKFIDEVSESINVKESLLIKRGIEKAYGE